MAEQQVIEEVIVTAKRINRKIPPLECPNVLLPTPANLTNYFGALITEAEKGILSEILILWLFQGVFYQASIGYTWGF